jgi:hypothetical protein
VDDYFQLNKKLAELEQVFIDRDALEACLSIEDYELYYSINIGLITEQPNNAQKGAL